MLGRKRTEGSKWGKEGNFIFGMSVLYAKFLELRLKSKKSK